jgi:hypothetical protein
MNIGHRIASSAIVLVITSAAVAAQTTTVFVPANALGGFGNPSVSGNQPYISAVAANGPGTISISYISGTIVDDPNINTGPDGVACVCFVNQQDPLSEGAGVTGLQGGFVANVDALIGIFVDQSRVLAPGFSPVDGTKRLAPVGLIPSHLFFIGSQKMIKVNRAGTLFLGINDSNGAANQGGFIVSVMFTPAP